MKKRILKNPIQDKSNGFLDSFVGRKVKVYRGGPESKEGTLLYGNADYLALHLEKEEKDLSNIVYYHTQHVRSISENSKSNSIQKTVINTMDQEVIDTDSFSEVVYRLRNKKVKINQGGPEATDGYLLDSTTDYLVLFTEKDGIVYFNIHHIKSVREFIQQEGEETEHSMTFFPANKFEDLFKRMTHTWVSINRGGPEALEGILVEIEEGNYTLINNEEVLKIQPFHVRSISPGSKGSFDQGEKEDSIDDEKNSNHSGDRETSGNRSSDRRSTSNRSSDRRSTSNRSNRRNTGGLQHRDDERTGRRDWREKYKREKVVKSVDYEWKPVKEY
ncbi:hypothetical protein [Cytobacillus purgationiresistens]|uniref:Spore coat protein B n=1 Tax=Cytobacillus purgationiresistens TaxID=863449 RepID=A0ABU0AD29_9BACI|nr:hypothetical protein [Cytobacillus purgationiresistens]MDQ0268950.1 spore coat protein B [Cytobacillus purgationiresistens]